MANPRFVRSSAQSLGSAHIAKQRLVAALATDRRACQALPATAPRTEAQLLKLLLDESPTITKRRAQAAEHNA